MELIKNKYKIRCEMGACRNNADYALVMDRSGIHSSICMCAACAQKLKSALLGKVGEADAEEALLCRGSLKEPKAARKKAAAKAGEDVA